MARVARERGLPLLKPETLRSDEAHAAIAKARCDVMVVAAFGLILPPGILAMPPHGCLNIHASLLPRWRGAAPVQRAILAGDSTTGITIMQMDAGLDTGPALLKRPLPIGARETAASLTESLAALGALAIVEALGSLDRLAPQPQDESQATYAAKLDKAEARIDWRQPNVAIDRQVRAFDPVPGAETRLDSRPLKIWEAQPVPGQGAPGEVIAADAGGIVVACGEGALRIVSLQRAGAKRLAAASFLLGCPLEKGQSLGGPTVDSGAQPGI